MLKIEIYILILEDQLVLQLGREFYVWEWSLILPDLSDRERHCIFDKFVILCA